MIGFGATVKSLARTLGLAGSTAILGLRFVLDIRRAKPSPIPILVEAGRRRR